MNKPNGIDAAFDLLVALQRQGTKPQHIAEVFECLFRTGGNVYDAEPSPSAGTQPALAATNTSAPRSAGLIEAEKSWFTDLDADPEWQREFNERDER